MSTENNNIVSGDEIQNPLMQHSWGTPFEVPPFEKIRTEHFMPAITAQIESSQNSIHLIADSELEASFENTIVALEQCSEELDRTLGVLFNLNSSTTSPEIQKVVMDITPLLSEYKNNLFLNDKLFLRVRQVWENREELNLNLEDAKLLEDTYKGFTRSGANLSESDKEVLRRLTAELAQLSVQFDQNELAAINDFKLHISNSEELGGLPDSIIEMARGEAKEQSLEGWLFTLHAPSYMPFLKYANSRELREKMWYAKGTLCATGDKNDNQEIIKCISNLRLELANLLGYPTYADYALERRMASSASIVMGFLDELLDKTIEFARKDVATIEKFAKDNGFAHEKLMPWDFSYWNEKYVTARYSVNDEMTRPYFKLEDAEQALFMLANKLYGIEFKENKEIPVYHPDVLAYEVYDKGGEFLAVLYCDYFPRASKGSGAWMNTFRECYKDSNGKEVRPIVVLVNNFTKPTESKPSLLSFGEFETMLHEFGHGLHGIFAKGSYASLTGTAVYRDFVELPSQVMENWAYEKEYLDLFAKHYESGEKMPTELIDKLVSSKNHNAAFMNVTQVRYGINDMAWHSVSSAIEVSAEEFEMEATKSCQILPQVEGVFMSPAFGHIFAGGYAAGYYSYKWAEVLDADAFGVFKSAGIFNSEVANSFRQNILERGGVEHPMELYKRFAGHEPTIEPLIERMGLK